MKPSVQPTLLERTQVGVWILLFCSVYLPLGDWIAGTRASPLLWWTHGLRFLWFILLLWLLRTQAGQRKAGFVALAAAGSIVATAAFASAARGDALPMLIIMTSVPLVTASLFPWGAMMQIYMVALCALLPSMIHWPLSGRLLGNLPTNTWFNFAALWALSVYLAYEYDRARLIIERSNRSLVVMNDSLERRVATRTEKLERANRDLASFAYSISHDLRAPLRTIDGFSKLVLESAHERLQAEERSHLETVRRAAQRMGLLIDALLSLSRLGQQEIQRRRVDLSELARAVAADLEAADPSRRVSLRIEDTAPAYADPVLIRDVVQNLIDNAWKYTAKIEQARIEFGSESSEGETVYYVRDNGVGFDMKAAGKLFDAFQRLHDPQEFEGTGIGLATVRRIVQLHGGRVWGESEPGAGAVFRFTLPQR